MSLLAKSLLCKLYNPPMHRIFMNPASLMAPEVLFEGEAFNHLFRACRVQIDEKVGVMDGQNHMTLVNVTKIEKTRAWGVKISSETLQVELPIQIDLAQAIGKKDKFEEVVDKATQLGVSNIIPLLTQHYMMLQRNLLYTAITRGKKLVVLVGSPKALELAVKNHDDGARFSGLLERLRDFLR